MRNLTKMNRLVAFYHKALQLQRDGLQRKPSFAVDAPERECVNCGARYRGNFCPACGQAATTRRFVFRDMFHSVFVTLLAGDNVFFRTSVALLLRPGYMVRDYLYGRRARYFKPVQMLVRLVAVYVLCSYIFNREYSVVNFVSDDIVSEHVHSETLARAIDALSSLLSNKAVYSLLLALISVLPFKLAFLGCKYQRPEGELVELNIAEHYYTLVYLSCLNLVVSILATPFSSVAAVSSVFGGTTFPLLLTFASVVYAQIFRLKAWNSILRSLLAIVLTGLFAASLVILAFGIFYGIDAVS